MALNIKSAKADRLARELAQVTGQGLTTAVTSALEEKLERERALRDERVRRKLKALKAIAERASKYPVLDPRSDDEIMGYNDIGVFD